MSDFRVGLTGGIASGKSTVGEILRGCDVAVVDADDIAAELTAPQSPVLATLGEALGEWIFDDAGGFDRKKVRARVFAEPEMRERLESVLHPLIRAALGERLAQARSAYAVGIVPLIRERAPWLRVFSRIAAMDIEEGLQMARAGRRDKMRDAKQIAAAQLGSQARNALADDIIDNNGDRAALEERVKSLHRHYLALAAATQPESGQ